MKYLSIIVTAFFLAIAITVTVAQEKPKIVFDKIAYEFGSLNPDSTYYAEFSFENKGSKPLEIRGVYTRKYETTNKSIMNLLMPPSVGWIIPSWTSKPVLPGNKGFVKVSLPLQGGRHGQFSEPIEVYSNADSSKVVLTISGIIK